MAQAEKRRHRTALLLMHFQDLPFRFAKLNPELNAEKFIDGLIQARDAAHSADIPVIHVQALCRPGYDDVSDNNRSFALLRERGYLLEGDPSSAFIPELTPQDGEIVIVTRRHSAFFATDLDMILRASGIDSVVLAGIATSGIVLSTVRDASDRDYRIVVLSDGCADGEPEIHRFLLNRIFQRTGIVLPIAEWITDLRSGVARSISHDPSDSMQLHMAMGEMAGAPSTSFSKTAMDPKQLQESAASIALHQYVSFYNAEDPEGVSMLFAPDGELVHPVRGATVGRDALAEFFADHLSGGKTKLRLLSFLVEGTASVGELEGTDMGTGSKTVVLDHIVVNDSGLIERLSIYRGFNRR